MPTRQICIEINSRSRRQHDYVLMSRPSPFLEAIESTNWHVNVNLRQLSNLTSASQLSKIQSQFKPTTRSTSTTSYTNPSSRSCWVAELATQEGNVVSVLEAVQVPAVVWTYFYLTLCILYLTRCPWTFSVHVYFHSIAIYMILYINLRKYTSCYPEPNIDVSTHCFLCSFVSTTCKYNWIYRLQSLGFKEYNICLGFLIE